MFAKGKRPGFSPKTEYLKQMPDAFCERLYYGNGLYAYAVFNSLGDDTPVITRRSSIEAWGDALNRLNQVAA